MGNKHIGNCCFLFFDGKAHAAIVLVLVVMFNGFRLIVLPKLMDKYGNIDIFACFKRKKKSGAMTILVGKIMINSHYLD